MSESGEVLEVYDLSVCIIACGTLLDGDIQGHLSRNIFLAALFRGIGRVHFMCENKNKKTEMSRKINRFE